ncbi:ABC-2 type transport system ATP-binding protein [Metabacillus crassostreae]|uniref:ABC transporter ATP-binding protein n=1 Tax=Metabacillus crassostreae TaxID=929098 RepID=UPI001958C28A|nr:ABC transporter ATP-binding protein [Metabacillus crassostreae]MBM7604135.1 ABC-2 type transport system ATP-binding protein [Metabacillus crassostreae]
MAMILCDKVNKHYENKHVVKDLDLTINKGEIFGLLGPNGAGKTTSISMMTSQILPSNGTIKINDLDGITKRKEIKKIVGIVPQDIALYPMLNAIDNLKFFGELYGIKGQTLKDRVNELLSLVGLAERAKEPIKNYSGGMKRRINIAAALIHQPLVVFMDEPTVGIDPQSRNQIFDLIKLLKSQGITIVYTTHYMEEATALCDRVAIIDDGSIIALGKVEELVSDVYGGVVELSGDNQEEVRKFVDIFQKESFTKDIRLSGSKIEMVVEDINKNVAEMLEALNKNDSSIKIINMMHPSLETLFLYKTGKKLRD